MIALWVIRETVVRKHGSIFAFICNALIRFLQFVGGLTVLGMYFALIKQEKNAFGSGTKPSEMMGLIVGSIAALAGLVEALPWTPLTLWIIDAPIFLCYVVLFGIYGQQLINLPDGRLTQRGALFKHAMWMDCANMVLWSLTVASTFLRWNGRRKERRMQDAYAYA